MVFGSSRKSSAAAAADAASPAAGPAAAEEKSGKKKADPEVKQRLQKVNAEFAEMMFFCEKEQV